MGAAVRRRGRQGVDRRWKRGVNYRMTKKLENILG